MVSGRAHCIVSVSKVRTSRVLTASLSSLPPRTQARLSMSVIEGERRVLDGSVPHTAARLQYIPVAGAGSTSLS